MMKMKSLTVMKPMRLMTTKSLSVDDSSSDPQTPPEIDGHA